LIALPVTKKRKCRLQKNTLDSVTGNEKRENVGFKKNTLDSVTGNEKKENVGSSHSYLWCDAM